MNPETPADGPDSAVEAVFRASLERQRARQGAAGRLGVLLPAVAMGVVVAIAGVASGGWMMVVLITAGVAIALAAWPLSRIHTREVRMHADATAEILERSRRARMSGGSGPWPDEPPAR